MDPDEVLRRLDLARRVAVEGEEGILPPHPVAVVAHLDEGLSPLLQFDTHVSGPGVDRVLHQFLHHRRRTFDHFACGDLVGDVAGEDLDATGHGWTGAEEGREWSGAVQLSNCLTVYL